MLILYALDLYEEAATLDEQRFTTCNLKAKKLSILNT